MKRGGCMELIWIQPLRNMNLTKPNNSAVTDLRVRQADLSRLNATATVTTMFDGEAGCLHFFIWMTFVTGISKSSKECLTGDDVQPRLLKRVESWDQPSGYCTNHVICDHIINATRCEFSSDEWNSEDISSLFSNWLRLSRSNARYTADLVN